MNNIFIVEIATKYEGPMHQWLFFDREAAMAKARSIVKGGDYHSLCTVGDFIVVSQVAVGEDLVTDGRVLWQAPAWKEEARKSA